jgi:uncharacterized protein YbjT (DUF2867 family)
MSAQGGVERPPQGEGLAHSVFVTGGTGYLGRALIRELLGRGHRVKALVRPGSESRLPKEAEPVVGDALDGSSYKDGAAGAEVFVHLVGTPRPTPWKTAQFRRVDLGSAIQAGEVARAVGVKRFVYVSVANPAPVMRSYIAIRLEAEAYLTKLGLFCIFLRPWYVLGPGHWWPVVLKPFYTVAEWIPGWKETARRIGFVSHGEMVAALVWAVEAGERKILDVPTIKLIATHSFNCISIH